MADNDSNKKDRFYMGPEMSNGVRTFVRSSADGKNISGGLVSADKSKLSACDSTISLHHLQGDAYEVEKEVRYTSSGGTDHEGPAKVNTPQFQKGWDRIFGKAVVGQA